MHKDTRDHFLLPQNTVLIFPIQAWVLVNAVTEQVPVTHPEVFFGEITIDVLEAHAGKRGRCAEGMRNMVPVQKLSSAITSDWPTIREENRAAPLCVREGDYSPIVEE
jgi:hypothetical protein